MKILRKVVKLQGGGTYPNLGWVNVVIGEERKIEEYKKVHVKLQELNLF